MSTPEKEIRIQVRVRNQEIKDAVDQAAKRRGRDTGPWLMYLAAKADPNVAEAMGIDPKATDTV